MAAATSLQKMWKVEVASGRPSDAWTAVEGTWFFPAISQFLRRDLYDWEEREEWEGSSQEYQRTLKEHISYYLHWDFSRRCTHGPLGVNPNQGSPFLARGYPQSTKPTPPPPWCQLLVPIHQCSHHNPASVKEMKNLSYSTIFWNVKEGFLISSLLNWKNQSKQILD